MPCPFCPDGLAQDEIVLESELCLFLQHEQKILIGSGIIVPRRHVATPFELTAEEWSATFEMLQRVKPLLDQRHDPDGYTVGWNVGAIAGQEVFHVHLHVIPRYADEPYAGKGIRAWIKKAENRRPSLSEEHPS